MRWLPLLGSNNTHKQGPSLVGVVGRPVASVHGFEYSEGLKAFLLGAKLTGPT